MQDYLQQLVIILPATAVAMGGLLLVVWIYSRRSSKGSESSLPVPLRSITTQVDEFLQLQINREIRNKLIEEAMESVKSILSENFRQKEATKISLEEFNNLYRKLDSGDMDAKHMESAFRIPGVASLAYQAPQAQSVPKTDSFATLWVEELQKSGDGDDSNISNKSERESELPEKEEYLIPPTETEPEPEITQELGFIETTDDVQSTHELKLLQDPELYLLTSSSNLYRSMQAFSMRSRDQQATLNAKHADVPTSIISDYEYLERTAELVLASVASTSTCTTKPHVLKGGGAGRDFEWRLDIEEKHVIESPPNTPVRRRLHSHLCRGVHGFVYEDHPPALSIIDDLSNGWDRGSEWKGKYGQRHIYDEHKGSSICRRQNLQLASDDGMAAHYKSERVEARRKWDAIENKVREERGRSLPRAERTLDTHQSAEHWRKWDAIENKHREERDRALPRADIHQSAKEWRKHLRTLYPDSSSESGSDQLPIRIRRRVTGKHNEAQGDGADDNNRINCFFTSSSSSAPESDESDLESVRKLLSDVYSPRECKTEHRHCKASPGADQGSSRSSLSSEIEWRPQ